MKLSVSFLLVVFSLSGQLCAGENKMNKEKYTNHLIKEKSPYLLQHAHNPVDWYPWGKEAFDKAKKEDKPIFLSIGYSTCHWCHVMEHESFENTEVAEILNNHFVSIKVDREERPDIDTVYMNVCQMLTGSGGWPLTIIMTPDKKPFFAATYIPRHAKFGRAGLIEILNQVTKLWKKQRSAVDKSADQITGALQSIYRDSRAPLGKDIIAKAAGNMKRDFDKEYGGFGKQPKFPSPHKLIFLIRYYYYTGDAESLDMVKQTLTAIRLGGICDQLGGGFHRYSTDRHWLLPHFEKMLYDQAMLSSAYLEMYQATGNQFYANCANEIFDYVTRVMKSPEGAFYSAEDADSDGEEGKFYVWSYKELADLLNKNEMKFMENVFNVRPDGNFKDEASGESTGKNILFLDKTLSDDQQREFENIRKKLRPVREKRIHPFKDTKVLTDWNCLMVASFAKAARILNSEKYRKAAVQAMQFLLDNMFDKSGHLMHRFRDGKVEVKGKVDDYAFMVYALISIYETTYDVKYLAKAVELTDFALQHFSDRVNGGLYISADYDEPLITRPKEAYDGAMPSGNSIFAMNLLRLAELTGNENYSSEAEGIIKAFAAFISKSPDSFAQMLSALQFAENPSREIMVVSEKINKNTREFLNFLQKSYIPDTVVLEKNSGNAKSLAKIAPFTKNYPISDRTEVYICRDNSCEPPLSSMSELKKRITPSREQGK